MTLQELKTQERYWHDEFDSRVGGLQLAAVAVCFFLTASLVTGIWGFAQGAFGTLAILCLWTYHAQRKANHYSTLATYLKESLKDDA